MEERRPREEESPAGGGWAKKRTELASKEEAIEQFHYLEVGRYLEVVEVAVGQDVVETRASSPRARRPRPPELSRGGSC